MLELSHVAEFLEGLPPPSGIARGWATFYRDAGQPADGRYAAAGPDLRALLGDWRGTRLRVTHGDRRTFVVLTDACWCIDRRGEPTVLDLSTAAFRDLGAPSIGVLRVAVEEVEPPRSADDLRMMREVRGDGLYR